MKQAAVLKSNTRGTVRLANQMKLDLHGKKALMYCCDILSIRPQSGQAILIDCDGCSQQDIYSVEINCQGDADLLRAMFA